MSLAPSERKALAAIETSLRTSDPKLAARMATFTTLVSRNKPLRWKCLSPWRLRIRHYWAAGLVTAVLVLSVVVAVFGVRGHTSSTSPGRCGITVEQLAGCHDQPVRSQRQQDTSRTASAQEQGSACPAGDPACIGP